MKFLSPFKYVFGILFFSLTLHFSADAQQFAPTFQRGCNFSPGPKFKEAEKRIYYEYGAVFISKGALPFPTCRFQNETEIAKFTAQFRNEDNHFGEGSQFYLQSEAAKDLRLALTALGWDYKKMARNDNNSTTTTDGLNDDWALRTYAQTQVNWGKPFSSDINSIIKDPGVVNSRKPTMFSVAIPGGSQHHFGLAIDVNPSGENECTPACEKALNDHGWYRTVKYDVYHFTYLGYRTSEELRSKGLKLVECEQKTEPKLGKTFRYWVPKTPADYKEYTGWKCSG